jgi:hypothetical protein
MSKTFCYKVEVIVDQDDELDVLNTDIFDALEEKLDGVVDNIKSVTDIYVFTD